MSQYLNRVFTFIFFILILNIVHADTLRTCEKHYKANRLTSGKSGNALTCYQNILKTSPNNAKALSGLKKIAARYIGWAKKALKKGHKKKAKKYLANVRMVDPESTELAALEARISPSLRSSSPQIGKKGFKDSLKNGSQGPEMIWIPAKKRFAMGRYEITFAEYDRFAKATHRDKPHDESWGRNQRPVINVSLQDAMAYTKWLSQQTGKKYRLPTDTEWEYAARANTKTKRYWGDEPDEACQYANVWDQTSKNVHSGWHWTIHNCVDNYVYTAPVGRFTANNFGLFDMLGNVWEWVCSEHKSGQKCVAESTIPVVIRGGSWGISPALVQSDIRGKETPNSRTYHVGFRIVRQ